MIFPWHKNAFAKLKQMLDQNHLPHALLITGAEKIGKFELATHFIQTLLCENNSCGECQHCRQLAKDNPRDALDQNVLIRRSHYPNMIFCRKELSDSGAQSKEIKVSQIRAFCDSLNKTADELQIGVIFYADEMNESAANSLLKTLEEPRKNTLIMLLAHNANALPATIRSRCQSVHISPAFDQQSIEWLSEHIDSDKRADFDAAQLLEGAHGVPFKAVDDLQGDYFLQFQGWQNHLLEMAMNPAKTIETKLFEGHELETLVCLQQLITEGIRLKLLKKEGALLELNKVASKASADNLFRLLDDISRSITLAQHPVNMKLLLDNVLIVWSHITHLKQYPVITNP
ncbi:MAG: DNA polymerase III subunit delta' [Gammaproteobacteria bacterium]|nr:DNA polymerase III subunit delta' [Gammaproteobacteria bacterium]